MKKVVIATTNKGKIAEMKLLLQDSPYEFVAQSEFKLIPSPENGLTFVENALMKARHAVRETGLPALSDDSGIMVRALGQRPGIYSSRYAGRDASSKEKIASLMAEWKDSGSDDRHIEFYCAMVFLRSVSDPKPIIAEGIWRGQLAHDVAGEAGFGYDPLFYIPELKCTAAQLSVAQKNDISHRAIALRELKEKLLLECD